MANLSNTLPLNTSPTVINNNPSPLTDPLSLNGSSVPQAIIPTTVAQPELAVAVPGAREFTAGTGATPTVLAPELTIADSDGGTLPGARVFIAKNFTFGDILGIQGSTGTTNGDVTSGTVAVTGSTLNWSYNSVTGVLSLDNPSGSPQASNEVFQEALRKVTFSTTSTNASPTGARDIQITLGDLLINPENRHFYRFVSSEGIRWTDANTAAGSDANRYFGLQGYLATITSQTEQNFIQQRLQGNGWIGASNVANASEWRWVTGPEGLEDGGRGRLFWQGPGTGSQAANANPAGSAFQSRYSNWQTGEPNQLRRIINGQEVREEYAHIIGNSSAYTNGAAAVGRWNDLYNDINALIQQDGSAAPFNPLGYIVEYGGLGNDPNLIISGLVTVNVNNGNVGDGIVLRNYSDGQDAIWSVRNFDIISESSKFFTPVSPDLNWVMVSAADFDGDNKKDDLLWRNSVTGENAIWNLEDGELRTGANSGTDFIIPLADLNWRIAGVADFNGDNRDDIVWSNAQTGQNAIWYINQDGTVNTTTSVFIKTEPGREWEIKGAGYFDADNFADLVWRNSRTGEVAIWLMNGVDNYSSGGFLPTVLDFDWQINVIADLNGDGKSDLAWQNTRTNEIAVWTIDNVTLTKASVVANVGTPDWTLEAAGDYNGDGTEDLVFRNYGTGENAIWWMFGVSIIQADLIKFNGNTVSVPGGPVGRRNWEIVDSYAFIGNTNN